MPTPQGPQNPSVDKQSSIAAGDGISYEVYSFNDQGQRKRHQVWTERGKAYKQVVDLKKLFGSDFKVGIRPIKDAKGNLYSQSVNKCRELVAKAARSGIVTASGKVETSKSPKASGFISPKAKIGSTKSGKPIHLDPGHKAHESFSSADHMDAYRAHAQQLGKLDPKETHPDLIEHHKQALNSHFKLGTNVKKSLTEVVDSCRSLLKAKGAKSPPPATIGKTTSGQPIHKNGNKGHNAKGWTAQDHLDAFHAHHGEAVEHRTAMMQHPHFQAVRNSDQHHYLTPEQTMARVSQNGSHPDAKKLLHHEAMDQHHHAIAEMHYQAYKKKKSK